MVGSWDRRSLGFSQRAVFIGEYPKGHYSLDSLNFMTFYLTSHQHQILFSKFIQVFPFPLLCFCSSDWGSRDRHSVGKGKKKKKLKWHQRKRTLPEIAGPLKSFDSTSPGKSSPFHVLKSDHWDELFWEHERDNRERERTCALFSGDHMITTQEYTVRVPFCTPKTYK